MNDEVKKQETWEITPKGWLAVRTGLFKNFDPVWDDFIVFCKEKAAQNGMTEGVPCLVLAKGGHCITANND